MNPSTAPDRERYIVTVLELYLKLPETPHRASPYDRARAAELHDQGIELSVVESALLLASLRRSYRPPGSPPLSPIRSLAYFRPVIEELLHSPMPADYLNYLRSKTGSLVVKQSADQSRGPALVQKNTLLDER